VLFEEYKLVFDKIIDSGLNNVSNLNDMHQLLLNMGNEYSFDEFKDVRNYAMKMSKYAHEWSAYMANQTGSGNYDDLYWKLRLFEAPELFDSYLIYLERKRLESAKFYEPKMKQLNKHGIIQSMQDLEDDFLDLLTISMPPGTQKCQPLYSKILTPSGFIQMKDACVGTDVVAVNGKVSKIISMSPIRKRKIYELTLDDGSKVRASDNHIWYVQTRDDRRRNKYRCVETSDMIKNLYVEGGKRANYSIDYVDRIELEEKEFLIHPYVMGVILGDGGISQSSVIISSKDDEILNLVNELLPANYRLKHKGSQYDYVITGHEGNNSKNGSLIHRELEKYDLFGKTSIHKFIPKDYLASSYEQRLWLLKGLMDTDGSAKDNYCSYATISDQLAKDVAELVHSLGGYASITKIKAGYKKDGEYIRCNDYYELIIQFSSKMESIFYLTRKKDIYKPKRMAMKRFIKSIEYIGDEDCRCIMISDPSHLYITDDYIITHNTTCEKFFTSWVIGRHLDDYNLFFSHSGDITRMYYDGVLDITTNDTEYCWNEIFPNAKLERTDAKREQINFNKYKPFANLQCSSVGSKNAGKVRCNRYLLNDDLIGGIEEALSKSRLDKIWDIYSIDARQRKLNEQVKEIHIATRWSVHDVIGRLQRAYANNPRCRFIAVPDIDPITGESNFDYKYNGMSVAFFNDQAALMDDISYRCLYKNEPIEREGLLYNEDELRRYLTLPKEEPDAIIGICDTKDKGSDYISMPVCYVYGNDYYMVDCVFDNSSDYGVQYENIANTIKNHKMQKVEFEHNNGGGRVAYDVEKLLEDKKYFDCNITSKQTTGNKETKIIVNATWVKKHVIFKDKSLYKDKDPYGMFMKFLLSYTTMGKNDHDDAPDSLAMLALFVQHCFGARLSAMPNPFWG